jgi:chromate reductase
MTPIRLLIIPGSVRAGSLNRQLASFAATMARGSGATAQELDLRSLNLPIYDGDLEVAHGIPEGAFALQQALGDSDAVVWVMPEYNGFPTPLVINALDWLSRIQADAGRPAGVAVTTNKPAALLSASPGPGGGLRAMNYLRQFLQMNFAMLVVPQQFALGKAEDAFDAAGGLKDARASQSVRGVLDAVTGLAKALQAKG